MKQFHGHWGERPEISRGGHPQRLGSEGFLGGGQLRQRLDGDLMAGWGAEPERHLGSLQRILPGGGT